MPQTFHHSRAHISPVGFVARDVTALSPLLIYEFVKDPHKQQRWARIAILGGAIAQHTLWAIRVRQQEHECEGRTR